MMQDLITFLKTLFLSFSVIISSMFGLNSTSPNPGPEDSTGNDIVIEDTTDDDSENGDKDETTTTPEEAVFSYTYLEYPAEAVKTIAANNTTVAALTARANKNDSNIYEANKGYEDVNGVIKSPYYTTKVDDKNVPVYAATVYIGETGKGALHSYSEIYITSDMADKEFEVKINSADIRINNAVLMTTKSKTSVPVSNGVVTVKLSGYGIYTFLFNNESQENAYTLFVKEEVDDDARIQELENQGYIVHAYSGLVDYAAIDAHYTDISNWNNQIIYLKKGTYVTADNKQKITNESQLYTEGSSLAGIGLTRYPLIGGSGVNNVKIMGYGTIDFTDLDRAERKGIVLTWGSNVEISGIKLVNATEWSLTTYRINGVNIHDVDIFGYRLNSDGMDICNSQNVTINNCFVRSGDDLFAIKTLGGDDTASCYSTNINVTNCVAWAGKARAFGISGEANRDIDNVTFKDCAVICHDATWSEYEIAAIGIMVSDSNNTGTEISNITFENINIYKNAAAAFSCYVRDDVGQGVKMSNITFKNINYNSNTVKSKIYSTKSGTSITATLDNVFCGSTKIGSNYASYIDSTSNVSIATY